MAKNNIAWDTPIWSDEFIIKFDIIINTEIPGSKLNILHVAPNGVDLGYMGNNGYPAVFAGGKRFTICFIFQEESNEPCQYYDYVLGKLYHIEISQKKNPIEEAVYTISIDGTTLYETINTMPEKFEYTILYLSNPWFESVGNHVTLSNLKVEDYNGL